MQHAFLTVDLGFGDAGKGTIVDYLTRAHDAHTVVRFNGGAQAGHRVVTAEATPREHVFAQFGSGTLAGAATYLSRFMLLDPLAMVAEERHLKALGVRDAFQRTTIDERALLITPFQRAVNRLKELARGAGRHGSCGMGIGETMVDALAHGERALFAGDLARPDVLHAKLAFLHQANLAKVQALRADLPDNDAAAREWSLLADDWADWLIDAYRDFASQARVVPGDHLHSLLRQPGAVVFEAAQGVLLDEWNGFHPYTTWSTTTLENADLLLKEAGYTGGTTARWHHAGLRHAPRRRAVCRRGCRADTGAARRLQHHGRLAAGLPRGLARPGDAALRPGCRRPAGLSGRYMPRSPGRAAADPGLPPLRLRHLCDRPDRPLASRACAGLPGATDQQPGALPAAA